MAFPVLPLLSVPGFTGTETCDYPDEDDVRAGTVYADGDMTGNITFPDEDEVERNVGYGSDGSEFTGTLVPCPDPPAPTGGIVPFALIAQRIVARVGTALDIGTDFVRPVASDRYVITETENLFAYVRCYGPTPVDPSTGQTFPDDGAGRWRRVVARRVRVYVYTRSREDLTGGDEIALGGVDTTQNVTTPPTLPGQYVAEELVMNALDDWTPTYSDDLLVTHPYTIGPLHQIDSSDGPPEREPENDVGLVRSHLDFQVCYVSAVQRTEPAPDGLPVPDLNND